MGFFNKNKFAMYRHDDHCQGCFNKFLYKDGVNYKIFRALKLFYDDFKL